MADVRRLSVGSQGSGLSIGAGGGSFYGAVLDRDKDRIKADAGVVGANTPRLALYR